jgi:hypothetical protein
MVPIVDINKIFKDEFENMKEEKRMFAKNTHCFVTCCKERERE